MYSGAHPPQLEEAENSWTTTLQSSSIRDNPGFHFQFAVIHCHLASGCFLVCLRVSVVRVFVCLRGAFVCLYICMCVSV